MLGLSCARYVRFWPVAASGLRPSATVSQPVSWLATPGEPYANSGLLCRLRVASLLAICIGPLLMGRHSHSASACGR
jgi:hypothetical protein